MPDITLYEYNIYSFVHQSVALCSGTRWVDGARLGPVGPTQWFSANYSSETAPERVSARV